MDPGTLLVEQGWQQAGSGYWTNPKIDKGEQRYSLDEAIVKEVQQQQKTSEWYKEGHCELLKILDEIKIAFKLECDYAAIPDALISKTAAKAETEQGASDMHHRSGGAGDERCLICCKDSEGRFKHYDVHEQVYLYIRQLEYAVQHPDTSKVREAYPTRFRGEKTESNAPHHDGCACLSCDPKAKRVPRPFGPDCNVPMSKTSDALGGNLRLMCEKCGQTIEADFPAKAKALIKKYGAERLKKALEEIDQESGKPLEQVTDNVLLKADTWGPSPRSDFKIKYIQVQDEIRERLEKLEEWIKAEQEAVEEADKAMDASYQRLTSSGDGPCEMPPPATVKELWYSILSNRHWIFDVRRKDLKPVKEGLAKLESGVDQLSNNIWREAEDLGTRLAALEMDAEKRGVGP